jgi:hypothetical protein
MICFRIKNRFTQIQRPARARRDRRRAGSRVR